MIKGAIFGGKRSKEDYGAVMNYARITPPSVKENYVDIAGGNSSIDLTEAVGGVVFDDGKIEFKFTLFSEADKNSMKNDLHGKRLKIILEKESDYYYDGRLSVAKEELSGSLYELYIEAKVKPYKLEEKTTLHKEAVNGVKELILFNTRMPAMPQITVTGSLQLKYEGNVYSLNSGVYEIPEITFYEGINRLNVSGKGSIKLEYRRGMII